MDYSLIAVAATAIKVAKEIGASALSIRDANLVALEITRMNDQLLQAQQALFTHNTDLLGLQQQLFETSDKLRKAEELIAQRGSYALVETGLGQWAYRVNVRPKLGGADQPGAAQSAHYVCQKCFDAGRKVVLKFGAAFGPNLCCDGCGKCVSASRLGAEFGF